MSADPELVLPYARAVLNAVADASGHSSILISSTGRTPRQEAMAIYDNCEKHGVAAQLALYKPPGCAVVRVYQTRKRAGQTRGIIVQAMTKEVEWQGPSRVSRHCADPMVLSVVDVALSSVAKDAFLAAARADKRISLVLDETKTNRCIHLEVPIPAVA